MIKTHKEPFIVSWSSKLMSQYRKHDLKLHVRSNREVDETVVLRWSAEIATQWSQYEYLCGKIDIPIGTTTGTVSINEENFAQFIDKGKGSKLENRIYFYFLLFLHPNNGPSGPSRLGGHGLFLV